MTSIEPFANLSHAEQLTVLEELAHTALDQYEIAGSPRLRLINLSENATYLVDCGDWRYALRVHRDGYHSTPAIASEISWLVALREAGIVITPRPVRTRDGSYIAQVGHPALQRLRSVVLFDWETGSEPAIDDNLVRPFEKLGAVTARMHAHSRLWQRPPGFIRHVWNFETALGDVAPHWGRWRDGMGMTPSKIALFQRTVATIGQRLAQYGNGSDKFGLVHGDLRLANLLIDGPTVKVIDFDDCGFSWFMYDVATPVSFYEDDPKVPELIDAWLRGYRSEATLSAADEAEIPTFVMLRRLLLVAWIGSHSETELAQSMGVPYTEGTVPLCEAYLARFDES
ncbi:MAG: phosphotransferase enzyme family protein [Paracoccaceae bacterium]